MPDTTTPLRAAGLLTRRACAFSGPCGALIARWVRRPTAHEVKWGCSTKKLSQNCGTPAPGRAGWPQNTAEGGCATRKGRSEIASNRVTGVLLFLTFSALLCSAPSLDGAAAGRAPDPEAANVPNVYGGGILFAFSGLDGKTLAAEPVVASTVAGTPGLRFHLPKNPLLKLHLPRAGEIQWRLVSNDLLLARVPGEEAPVVVAFLAPNVVVGRLPASARVSLEGGDYNIAIMRGEVGDRTQFAVVWHPKGARTAAAIASQALQASMDTLVEGRLEFFPKLPPPPDNTPPVQARTLAKAFSVMKVNVYSPEDTIKGRWTTPARWPQQYMYLWDTAFNALGLAHLDMALAKESLLAAYGFQAESGLVPTRMGPGVGAAEASQPPLLGWGAWEVFSFDRMRDREFLQKSFDTVQKHVLWYMRTHRLDGEPPPEKPVEHGTPLYAWKSAEESGEENSPRFDAGAAFAAVDLSAYLANECRVLQEMAQRLGYRELAKTWGARADAIAQAARRQLWDDARGFFFDRKAPDGEWGGVWSSAGFLPLWAGIATPEQAARLKEHLLGKKFWTAMPVPSVARDDTSYKKDMWRGPAWPNMNYLIIRGLRRYGFEKEAADLRAKTLAGIAKWYGQTGALAEFYDADDQTPPADLARKEQKTADGGAGNTADYFWTASVYADLLLRPKP